VLKPIRERPVDRDLAHDIFEPAMVAIGAPLGYTIATLRATALLRRFIGPDHIRVLGGEFGEDGIIIDVRHRGMVAAAPVAGARARGMTSANDGGVISISAGCHASCVTRCEEPSALGAASRSRRSLGPSPTRASPGPSRTSSP